MKKNKSEFLVDGIKGPILTIILGIVVIPTITFLIYNAIIFRIYTTEQPTFLTADDLAYSMLTITLGGLALFIIGTYLLFSKLATTNSIFGMPRVFGTIAAVKRYRLTILLATVPYAVFFAFVSGMLVFQTALVSQQYGTTVPSMSIALCCGSPGQVPVFIAYLTNNIGLVIVPLNLLLMVGVSFLVGINVASALFAYDQEKFSAINRNWPSFIGASAGLFMSCPTCAALFVSSLVGLSGAFTLVAGLSWFQPLLILTGLFALVAGPLVISRKFPAMSSCSIPDR